MDFEEILKELKKSLLNLFKDKYTDFSSESKKDIEYFLTESKEKLQRWTVLLQEKKLTLDDYEWLIKSQKDLFLLKALQTVGISKISLGHFKNKIVDTIVNTVRVLVL